MIFNGEKYSSLEAKPTAMASDCELQWKDQKTKIQLIGGEANAELKDIN